MEVVVSNLEATDNFELILQDFADIFAAKGANIIAHSYAGSDPRLEFLFLFVGKRFLPASAGFVEKTVRSLSIVPAHPVVNGAIHHLNSFTDGIGVFPFEGGPNRLESANHPCPLFRPNQRTKFVHGVVGFDTHREPPA